MSLAVAVRLTKLWGLGFVAVLGTPEGTDGFQASM